MCADFTVREAAPEDLPALLSLMERSLGEGGTPRTEAFWRWKHADNPFGASPVLVAVSGEGSVVGLRAFLRWQWSAGDEVIRAVRAVDTATDPAFRRRGIFRTLTLDLAERMRSEGVRLIFNTPGAESLPAYLSLGWNVVGRTPLRLRPLRPLRMAGAWLRRTQARPEGTTPLLGDRVHALLERPEVGPFLQALSVDARLHTRPEPRYLAWRYGQVPGVEYRALAQVRGTEGGVLIFRIKPRGELSELRLCEVIVGGGERSPDLVAELLHTLFRGTRAHFASAMAAPQTPAYRVLSRAGFLPPLPVGPTLTTFPLNRSGAGPNPLRAASWALATGDLELF